MIDWNTLGLARSPSFAGPQQAASRPVPPSAKSPFSRIYAFGDSLSDAGNVYTLSGGVLPDPFVYANGRFSNGPVWVQLLARDLGLPGVGPSLRGGTDFAYGGAETGSAPLHSVSPLDLPTQLTQFQVQVPSPSPTALYTLSIGGNDVLDTIGDYTTNLSLAMNDVQAAVNNELGFIGKLAADGAHNLLILNVPDLGKTPQEAGVDAPGASYLSLLYDWDLATLLPGVAAANHLDARIVNSYSLIDYAVANPSDFGLTNVTAPVWTGDFTNPFSGHFNATGAGENKYLFFDHLHPTETGHEALALSGLLTLL